MRMKVLSARAGAAAFLLLFTVTALEAQTLPVTIGESAPLSSRSGDPIVQQPAGPHQRPPTPASRR